MLEAIQNSQGLVSKIQRHLKAITGENICWEATERHIHRWQETEAAVKAEKEAEAKKLAAEAERFAAEQKALGIQAVGQAEAEAIEKKAEAMKKMGEASVLQLILDSNVLPDIVKASSEPIAAAYSKIGNITMYGDGNQTKLAAEITNNSSQVIQSVEKSLGIDLKAVLAGYLGGKLGSKVVVEDSKSATKKEAIAE